MAYFAILLILLLVISLFAMGAYILYHFVNQKPTL